VFPDISTQVLSDFFCLYARVPSCSCALLIQPARFKFIRSKPISCDGHQIMYLNYAIQRLFAKLKFRALCLKPLHQTILTSSLSHCAYQKDDRAKLRKLPKELCTSPMTFPFTHSSTMLSSLSLSVPLYAANG
jgi:hypothetical protein